MTGVKMSTQYSIIRRWLQRNMNVVSHMKNNGKEQMLSSDQKAYLANPKILQEMRHLSLS